MVTTTNGIAIRTDRARPAACGGTKLGSHAGTRAITARLSGVTPMVPFSGVPAYVTDQEYHPPRGCSPA